MPASETRFAVLLFTDIVGSTDLKARHGIPAYSVALRRHNEIFESLARGIAGSQIIKHLGDGYFAVFAGVADAVRFALLFQHAMRSEPWDAVALTTRLGIHAGEIADITTLERPDVLAPAADLAARVMSLAVGGQILLTRFPFDEARHFLREHPPLAGIAAPSLRWLAHGPYEVKGLPEPIEVFEVGAENLAPLAPPPDSEKVKRAIRAGEEGTLGWRPAVGMEVPSRAGWMLNERLGAGGFGEVWVATHARLGRRRAFKFCFDEHRLRALKREVTLTSLLHTALGERDDIVRLFELKLDEPPYFLESEYAPEGNLLQWGEKQGGLAQVPLETRLELVAATAAALGAAHSIGVLHKDIKPSNVLVFKDRAGAPRPRLVDFGIGTLSDSAVIGQMGLTAAGTAQISLKNSSGTPLYSPPEYLAGKPYTVQGDIFGLGVMLFQMVIADAQRPLAYGWERDVPDPLIRDDIAACVDGDPARRLPAAADLAARLRALDQRRLEAAQQSRLARAVADLAELEQKERIARLQVREASRVALGAALDFRDKLGDFPGALAQLAKALEYDPANERAQIEVRDMLMRSSDKLRPLHYWLRLEHSEKVNDAGFSADGRLIGTSSQDGNVRVWETATGRQVGRPIEHFDPLFHPDFSPDGRWILTKTYQHTAIVVDVATGGSVGQPLVHSLRITDAAFSSDGRWIVTTSDDMTARIWEAGTGTPIGQPFAHGSRVHRVAFSPDGRWIVTTASDRTARVWEAETGKRISQTPRHEADVRQVSFSPDGRCIVTACDTGAHIWEASTGTTHGKTLRHDAGVCHVSFSPDGCLIVTASRDKTARIWDAATGNLLGEALRHNGCVRSASFSPDGRLLVTASDDKSARVWKTGTGVLIGDPLQHDDGVRIASFSPDGRWILTVSRDCCVRVWQSFHGRCIEQPLDHQGIVSTAAFSPDGTAIVTSSVDGNARVWDAATGRVAGSPVKHEGTVLDAAFSPDGKWIATASDDNVARIWDVQTGTLVGEPLRHQGPVHSVDFSPDGSLVVTASSSSARVWEAGSGALVGKAMTHRGAVFRAAFSRGGQWIVTTGRDGTARVWEVASGKPVVKPLSHDDLVSRGAFSPGDHWLVTASQDGTARIWDVSNGYALTKVLEHDRAVTSAEFSADGRWIVTASSDGDVQVWETEGGRPIGQPLKHPAAVWSAAFSPDGRWIVTACDDAAARVWETALPLRSGAVFPADLLGLLHQIGGVRINSDGQQEMLPAHERIPLRQVCAEWEKEIAAASPGDPRAEWLRLLSWMFAEAQSRPLSPNSKVTASRLIERILAMSFATGSFRRIEEAYDIDPQHPLIHIAFAAQEEAGKAAGRLRRRIVGTGLVAQGEGGKAAEFLREYDSARLPADARICGLAAKYLAAQNDFTRALRAARRGLEVESGNEECLRLAEECRMKGAPPVG